MKTSIVGAAVATVLLTGLAQAQVPATPPTPTAPPAASATTTLTLAPADVTTLKTWITGQKTASVPAPTGFTVAVGATVPATITLNPIPASAGMTAVGMNQYAVIDNQIVLVSPTDRKIVYVFA